VAGDAHTLARYIVNRHRHGEQLRLREIKVRQEPGGLGHIEYRLDRRADDLAAPDIRTTRIAGKGAIDCAQRKIVAWSMEAPTGPIRGGYLSRSLCPQPTGRPSSPIACTA
jgi:hypothetical protein